MPSNRGLRALAALALVGQLAVAQPAAAEERKTPVERETSIQWDRPTAQERATVSSATCQLTQSARGRFRGCYRGPLLLRTFQKDPRTGRQIELGSASGQIALVVRAPARDSRRMTFEFSVTNLQVRGGYTGGTMTVEIGCRGAACGSATAVTKLLSVWQSDPRASYAFTGRLGRTAPAFAADGRYFVRVTVASAADVISEDSLGTRFRCDGAGYLQRGQGCVLSAFAPTITFDRSEESKYRRVAEHINMALAKPGSTKPPLAGKTIPRTLHRRFPAEPRDDRYVAGFCREYFKVVYQPPDTECDEYPFNASQERPVRGKPTNFSVRPVPARQNGAAGNHLKAFYKDNRVLDKEAYKVRTTK